MNEPDGGGGRSAPAADRSERGAHSRGTPLRTATWEGVRAMLELSPDAVLAVDTHGSVQRLNDRATALFRGSRETLAGSHIDDLVPSELRRAHEAHRIGYAAEPAVRTMGSGRELMAQRADGSRFPADVSLQPLEVDGERLVLAVVRDLTQHIRLREDNRALAADAATLREFLSVASHELRTPLTSVRGFAESLRSGRVRSEREQQELLDRIVRNADRQDALITGLLDLARIQGGRIAVDITDVEVDTALADAIDTVADVEATIHTSPGLVVRADELRLLQVLVNLLTNAVRYGVPPIVIDAHRTDAGRIRISVTDHGPGVPEGFADHLFDAFSQGRSGDRPDAPGLGLGLYIAQQVSEAMAGHMSYRPGEAGGSTFTVELPAAGPRAVTPG